VVFVESQRNIFYISIIYARYYYYTMTFSTWPIAEPSEWEKNDRRYEKAHSRYAYARKIRKRTTCARLPYACDIPAKCIVRSSYIVANFRSHLYRRSASKSASTRLVLDRNAFALQGRRSGMDALAVERKYREHELRILRLSEFRDEHAGVENRSRSNEPSARVHRSCWTRGSMYAFATPLCSI